MAFFKISIFEKQKAIFLIFLLSVLVPLLAINWGIKGLDKSWLEIINPVEFTSYNPDEPFCMYAGYTLALGEKLKPNHFYWGGTGTFTISKIIAGFFLLFDTFSADFIKKYAYYHILIGRLISIFAGFVSTVLLYKSATRLFDNRVGLFSAFLFCFSPIYIENALQFRPDMCAIFGTALCLFGFSKYSIKKQLRYIIIASIGSGIASAFRLPNGTIILGFIIYILTDKDRTANKVFHVFLIFITFISSYTALSYHYLSQPDAAFSFFGRVKDLSTAFATNSLNRDPIIFYMCGPVLVFGVGKVLTMFLYISNFKFFITNKKKSLFFIIAFLLNIYFLGKINVVTVRYALPLVFISMIPVGHTLMNIKNKIFKNCVLFIIISSSIFYGFNRYYTKIQKDSRLKCIEWINNNIPKQSKIGLLSISSSHYIPWVNLHNYLANLYTRDYSTRFKIKSLEDADVDYWIIHEIDWREVERLGDRHPNSEMAAFIKKLKNNLKIKNRKIKMLKNFKNENFGKRTWEPEDFLMVSPGLELYQLY